MFATGSKHLACALGNLTHTTYNGGILLGGLGKGKDRASFEWDAWLGLLAGGGRLATSAKKGSDTWMQPVLAGPLAV